ncbi:MAG: hypothetical protein KJT03_23925, partial [Verrucomicrobiae bacterium]|nr:hypothetical protein [Verrucomicrobiae bacterium]
WQIDAKVDGDEITFAIPVTQNRIYEIQESNDLEKWEIWQTDGNPFQVGDEAVASVKVNGPYDKDTFYRISISELN